MRMPTGVRRLDELLGGGLPENSATLVYGPPFIGKEAFARHFVAAGHKQGMPAIMVLTDSSTSEARREFAALDPQYLRYEKEGLIHYVDAYSRSIGTTENFPCTEYVDGLLNFNSVSVAVNNAQRKIIGKHAHHRLVFDSVSTLITYTNAQTAFRYLQVLIGQTKAAGATSLMLLERGMHPDAEVQTIKHLMSGVVEFKTEQGKNLLHAEGLGLAESRGWVEYKVGPGALEITGSFAAGRIR